MHFFPPDCKSIDPQTTVNSPPDSPTPAPPTLEHVLLLLRVFHQASILFRLFASPMYNVHNTANQDTTTPDEPLTPIQSKRTYTLYASPRPCAYHRRSAAPDTELLSNIRHTVLGSSKGTSRSQTICAGSSTSFARRFSGPKFCSIKSCRKHIGASRRNPHTHTHHVRLPLSSSSAFPTDRKSVV